MNTIQIKVLAKLRSAICLRLAMVSLYVIFCFCPCSNSQTNETPPDKSSQYDNLLDIPQTNPSNTLESPIPEPQKPKDEILSLLPDLNNGLYQGWTISSEPIIWTTGNKLPDFITTPQDLITELQCEKILKQTYIKEKHAIDIIIYKLKDYTEAYSIYTLLHSGTPAKLKVGKNVSETDKSLNFWKSNFYISILSNTDKDTLAKEFIVLASQDISKNIKVDQIAPIVSIQLPALYKVQNTEKFCSGSLCCETYLPKDFGFDYDILNLPETTGIISADYRIVEDKTNKKPPTKLLLVRYKEKGTAESIYKVLKEIYKNKKAINKDLYIDSNDKENILKMQTKKSNFTMLKQKGNLLAVSLNKEDRKASEQIIELVPWPVEIIKPINLPIKQ